MRVCKIGHSCVVVEAGGARLLVDPGVFTRTEALANVGPIDAVLYTHGHTDHIDRDRLRLLLAARPDLPLYADRPTGELIDMWDLGVGWTELQGGGEVEIRDVSLRVWEGPHHPIHPRVDAGRNLSLLFDGAFLHPGDALFRPPGVEVKLLAVPFAPFVSLAECIDYGLDVRPERVLPLHDGYFAEPGPYESVPQGVWSADGVRFEWVAAGGVVSL